MAVPDRHDSVDACVQRIVERCGSRLAIAAPLGLGKPNALLNALYRRAERDPAISLQLYTALSLARPAAKSDLERRFIEPFVARHFGRDYPDLAYLESARADRLPPNVRVSEFYLQSGAMLGVAPIQRAYASINYTHVARELAAAGVNAIVQLIAKRVEPGGVRYSLSCNPDVTLDLLDRIEAAGKPRPLVVGQVHPDLPFLGNDAEVPADFFDLLLESPSLKHELFALPHEPVSPIEFALGLHASQLVRDGGTLQIGIGTLSDALVYASVLRHQQNSEYLSALKSISRESEEIHSIGGKAPFETGLYGASEMLMDGFMHLARAGILKRRVHDDPKHPRGFYLHAAFFLGSKALYEWLRNLKGDDFDGLCMTRVSRTNDLHGAQELRAGQRRDARFFNICMMATALGAAVSDALETGQVVSGVGGQYNFVAMAHALEGGRSVLMLRSTRASGGKLHSNIVWQYGHTTIPRHLRDLVVTEYGVADLRGKSDEDTIKAMIAITDARFQGGLAQAARRAGKLAPGYRIPDSARANTPERIATALASFRERGLFPEFPFGSDFTAEEQRLVSALQLLKGRSSTLSGKLGLFFQSVFQRAAGSDLAPFMERMSLGQPKDLKEKFVRRLLALALRKTQ